MRSMGCLGFMMSLPDTSGEARWRKWKPAGAHRLLWHGVARLWQ